MRIAALADLHGFYPEVPDCDVLVIAGDIVLHNPGLPDWQMGFYLKQQLQQFSAWLEDLFHRHIFVMGVAGNHDFAFAEIPDLPRKLAWTYLEDEAYVFDTGHVFYGTPWQPWMGGWAFNAPESELDDYEEPFLDEKFRQIPGAADVIIAHTPPAGFHDTVQGAHKGSIALNKHIERVKPRLVVYGHIHKPGVETVGRTTLCNAAYVGFNRKPNGHPIQVFDL